MKTAIMFAVASLILVGAVIAIALPNPVQADNHPYCIPGAGTCADTKKLCKDLIPTIPGADRCVKVK